MLTPSVVRPLVTLRTRRLFVAGMLICTGIALDQLADAASRVRIRRVYFCEMPR